MKILLLNDNANVSHVGCLAVSDAHARMLGAAGHTVERRCFLGELHRFIHRSPTAGIHAVLEDREFRSVIEAVDAVVVNGEGTIHHGAGTEYLCVLGAAKMLKKKCLLVNAVIQQVEGWDEVLLNLDDITLRDNASLRYLEGKGIKARLVLDSFLAAGFGGVPLVDLADKVVVTDWHHARDSDVGIKCMNFIRDKPAGSTWFLPFLCKDVSEAWRRIPATLATAKAVVTGRHHAIYAAAIHGVPFVAMPSNTYKIEGFLEMFPELGFCFNPESIEAALEQALANRKLYLDLAVRMRSALPLSTFSSLGNGSAACDGEGEINRLRSDIARHCAANPDPVDLVYRLTRRNQETRLAVSSGSRS